MTNDLENLTKILHSIQFAVSDLKELVQSDNLLLVELAMETLKNLADEEAKVTRIIKILELNTKE